MKQVWKVIVGWLKRYFSVSFVAALILSFVLWSAIKLGHSYTAEAKFDVLVAEQSAECTAVVEGTGYQIVKFKYDTRNGIAVEGREVRLRRIKADSILIEPSSLLRTLTAKYSTIKIVSIEKIDQLK